MKVVLDARPGSGYRDSVERYHFPLRYLHDVAAAVGDWAVYYEPSREGGRRADDAAGLVDRVEPDHDLPGHHFAYMRHYLAFDVPVPLRGIEVYREARLREVAAARDIGRTLQGRSVREIPGLDFAGIVEAGLADALSPGNAIRLELAGSIDAEAAAILGAPPGDRAIERLS